MKSLDKRLEKNFERIYNAISEHQSVCLRKIGKDQAGERMMGRFFANEDVTLDVIISEITNRVKDACVGRHVLCIQDTTKIDHKHHADRVKGLGPIGNEEGLGFYIHPVIVVDVQEGSCLGISSIIPYIRKEVKKTRDRTIPIEKRETYRWLQSCENSKESLQQAKMITIVADRESDIYEEYARIPDDKTHLLTRACHNRYLENGERLFDYVETLPVKGSYKIDVKKTEKREAREARMSIRFSKITMAKSSKCKDKNVPDKLDIYVVDVKEHASTVPAKEEPIHWCLLTTHFVELVEDALEIIHWYQQRWHIEQLFRTLKKQGLNVESSQLETAEKLIKLTCMALQVALQTMQLTLARTGKDQSIKVVFNAKECDVLKAVLPTIEGKTAKQKNPHKSDRLSWASWIIARLGGWKGYASESPPGPITMRDGLAKFKQIYIGYYICKKDVYID